MSMIFWLFALHLSKNSATVGIWLSIVSGTAAASSTMSGTDRYPLKNSRWWTQRDTMMGAHYLIYMFFQGPSNLPSDPSFTNSELTTSE